MKEKILFFLILILLFSSVSATNSCYPIPSSLPGSLSGKIINIKTSEPIAGATIYIPDLKRGTITDSIGQYKLENLPTTKLLFQISYLGFKTVLETLDCSVTKARDFEMEQTITEIPEMVITGTSRAAEIRKNPVPMAIMERKEIDQVASANIIDIISKVPGVSAVNTGPNISKPFIHGLGYNRVLTLVDGIRQEGQQWGDEHGIEIDENLIGRIEIIKGPASLTYGSDALAGVVNLIPYPSVMEGEIKSGVMTEYQTNNKLIGSSAYIDGNSKGWIWGGRLSFKMASNYRNKIDGRVYGTSFSEKDASFYTGVNKSWGYSHLNFSLYNDLQMIPDGSRDSLTRQFTKQVTEDDTFRPVVSNAELNSYTIGILHQHIQHYKIYSSNNFIIGDSRIGLTLGFQQNLRQEFSHPQAPSVAGLSIRLNTLTYDLKYHFPDKNNWESTFGINGMIQQNQNRGTEFIIPDYHLLDIGPFFHLKKNLGKFDLSGGIRWDSRFFYNDAMYVAADPLTGFDTQVSPSSPLPYLQQFDKYRHVFAGLSGSIGSSCRLNDDLTFKINISRGFRAPNISEISANGVHPGTNIYQIGNLDFKPEFTLQEDFGIYYARGHFNGSVELFNADLYNYIFNQKLLNHLGKDSVIVERNQTFKFQQSRAHLYGGEITADIHPHPLDWIHFENSLSFVYADNKGAQGVKIAADARYLPFIPPLHWRSVLRTDFSKKSRTFSNLYFRIGMDWYARQNRAYLAYNTETPTPGYTLFEAGTGTDLLNLKKKNICSIHLTISNLFDIAYQSHLSRLKYFEPYPNNRTGRSGIFDMGRNIGVKLLFPIDATEHSSAPGRSN